MVDKRKPILNNSRKMNNNRRNFLASVVGVGSISFAGCMGSGSNGSSEASDASDDQEASYGGHLEMAFEDTVQHLNPMLQASVSGYGVLSQLYSSLVIMDPDLELYGDLAEDWESNDDATEWTFYLRENATWHHNGENVTAEDVSATLEKVIDPDTGSPGEEVISSLEETSINNDYEVTLFLSEGDADVPAKMNNQWLRIMPEEVVNDNELFENARSQDFGCGPFVLEDWEQGNYIELTRFEDYHLTSEDGDELPYLDEFTIYVYPDESTMRSEMENGGLDLLSHEYPNSIYEDLQGSPDIQSTEVPSGLCYPLLMNPNIEPFDDQRVRHAIKHAIDKEAVLQVAGRNLGVLGKDNFVSPAHQYYADLDDPFGSSSQTEEANELLEDAGYSDGLEIPMPLKTPSDFGDPIGPTATIIQDNCSQVGIDIEIEQVSTDYWLSNVEGSGDFYMGLYSYRPVEDEILRQVLHSEGPWNYGFASEEFDEAIDQARVTTDEDERQELFAEAQEIAQMNAGMAVPFFSSANGLYRDVGNYEQHPSALKFDAHDLYIR